MIGLQTRLWSEPVRAGEFQPRAYQLDAVDAIFAAFQRHRRVMLVLFPGAGKTRTASLFVKRAEGRGLWLADTDFLLDQARGALEEVTNELTTLEQGPHRMGGERIVIASMQTLRAERLLRKAPDTFAWIVVDEAHGVLAPTYRRIIEHFTTAKVLGLSATPFRLDKKRVVGEGGFFETIAYQKDVNFGISEGYLCPIRPSIREVKEIDLSNVRVHGGDLKLGDLEKQIIKAAAPIAHVAWEESNFGELPTLIYTPGVASAKAVAATFRALAVERWGDESCVAVDGDTPTLLRRRIRRDFGKQIRAIANCNLLTQGVDLPIAACGILGRPTMSLALFQQMGLRPGRTLIPELPTRDERIAAIAASPKPWFKLVDLAGNSGRHNLVTVVDALAGDLTPPEKSQLRKRLMSPRPDGETLDESVAEAKKASVEEIRRELELRENEIAAAAAQARVKAVKKGWDPFARIGAGPFNHDGIKPEWLDQQPTAEQVMFLRKNKITPKIHTRGTVEALQRQAREWHARGLATINQRRKLAAAGVDPNQSYGVASRLIDELARWGYNAHRARAGLNRVLNEGRQPGED